MNNTPLLFGEKDISTATRCRQSAIWDNPNLRYNIDADSTVIYRKKRCRFNCCCCVFRKRRKPESAIL